MTSAAAIASARADAAPAIEICDVSMRYVSRRDRVDALANVSFSVSDGEFVALLGRSGCGKSTLLKMIAGLLRPTSGEVRVDGTEVTGPVSNVGMVFQSPVLLKWRTALRNVLFPAEALGQSRKYEAEARRLLGLVGLSGFEQRYPAELSGGMAQRVSLARALLLDPRLLLMDEPFGALDALTRQDMNLELLRIWSERRKTILFVTHDIAEAVFLADRVIVLSPRPGRIEEMFVIDLPRPRSVQIIGNPRFGELVLRIQQLLGLGSNH
jgi:NitT/TauT family transport system ATP-binding protein